MSNKKSIFKKILLAITALFLLLIIAIAIIPFVVDVDKYRPTLVGLANQKINGKLEVGKLSLSLWGRILVKIDGIKLSQPNGQPVVNVLESQLYIPIWPLIQGKPQAYFEMTSPKLWIEKDKEGKFNFQNLMKDGRGIGRVVPPVQGTRPGGGAQNADHSTSQAESSDSRSKASQEGTSKTEPAREKLKVATIVRAASRSDQPIPWSERFSTLSLATHARVGLRLYDMTVHYQDNASSFKTQIDGLNWEIKEISMTRPMESRMWGNLDAKLSKDVHSSGRFEFNLNVMPEFEGSNLRAANAKIVLEASDLDIKYADLLRKQKGVKFRSEITLHATPEVISILKAQMWFHEAELKIEGKIKTSDGFPADLKFTLNPINIANWNTLILLLSSYGLDGKFGMEGVASSVGEKTEYSATIRLDRISVQAPYLKSKVVLNSQLEVRNERLDLVTAKIHSGSNTLDLNGSVEGFESPVVQLKGVSERLNLDEMIDFEAMSKREGASIDFFPMINTLYAQPAAEEDYDLMLAAIKSSSYFLKTTLNADLKLKQLIAMGYQFSDLVADMFLKNGVSDFKKLDFSLYGGRFSTQAKVDLKPARPSYQFVSSIQALDMETAVKQNADTFKNTAFGKLNLSLKGTGSSFNPELAKQNLNVSGGMNLDDARFTSIDIGKMATEAINNSIERIAGSIPQIKGKKVNGLPKGYSSYEKISSDYSIQNGKFIAPNFVARAKPERGIDLKGYTEFGIVDKTIKAKWNVIDRFNVLKAKDLSVSVAGVDVKSVLADGNPPVVSFPVTVTGTLDNPKYSYEEIPKHFTNIALKKVKQGTQKGLTQKAKDKILESPAVKKAPKKVKDLLKKVF